MKFRAESGRRIVAIMRPCQGRDGSSILLTRFLLGIIVLQRDRSVFFCYNTSKDALIGLTRSDKMTKITSCPHSISFELRNS